MGRGSLLVGVHEEGLEVGHGLVEAGEADGALVTGVCNYLFVSGGGLHWLCRGGESLRIRGSDVISYLASPRKMESAESHWLGIGLQEGRMEEETYYWRQPAVIGSKSGYRAQPWRQRGRWTSWRQRGQGERE